MKNWLSILAMLFVAHGVAYLVLVAVLRPDPRDLPIPSLIARLFF